MDEQIIYDGHTANRLSWNVDPFKLGEKIFNLSIRTCHKSGAEHRYIGEEKVICNFKQTGSIKYKPVQADNLQVLEMPQISKLQRTGKVCDKNYVIRSGCCCYYYYRLSPETFGYTLV